MNVLRLSFWSREIPGQGIDVQMSEEWDLDP
jgi:hypothetical protein